MPTIVKMPKWGLTMTTGTVTGWIRDEGDEVSAGDPLLTVETEKAVNDIEAPADGVLYKIVVPAGDAAAVSAPIAIIAAAGESLTESDIAALIANSSPAGAKAAVKTAESSGSRTAQTASRDDSGRVNASPAARKLARELGVDLGMVAATGPGGRVTSDDVERAAASSADDPSVREEMIAAGHGVELAALIAGPGNAQPLVFLHGLGGSFGTWEVVLGDLAARYRVIALDLPGHGKSSKHAPDRVDYSLSGLTELLQTAIASLTLTKPILVGHSLGGALALRLALTLDDQIGGVVLIDSAGLGEEVSPHLLPLMAGEPGKLTARGLLELFYEDQRLVLDRGVDDMAQTQVTEGAWAAQQAVASGAIDQNGQRFDLLFRLRDVKVPVLMIWGELDRVIPLDHAMDALMLIPDAALRIVTSVGHVPQVEAPGIVATAIDRFAKSLA